MIVVVFNVVFNGLYQLIDALECASANAFACDFTKPSLHKIEPGRRCGDEMKMETRMLPEPDLNFRMFVCAVIVHDAVDIQILRSAAINRPQEF